MIIYQLRKAQKTNNTSTSSAQVFPNHGWMQNKGPIQFKKISIGALEIPNVNNKIKMKRLLTFVFHMEPWLSNFHKFLKVIPKEQLVTVLSQL